MNVSIVTGGARGIGRAIARGLAGRGDERALIGGGDFKVRHRRMLISIHQTLLRP